MGFVFKHHQPVLFFSVDLCLYFDAACIDFFRFIQVVKHTLFFQVFGSHAGHIHQADIPLFFVHFLTHFHIFFKGLFYHLSVRTVFKLNPGQLCIKGSVPAVVRPVSINDLQFCQGWIPFLFVFEVVLNDTDIIRTHRKFHFFAECFQLAAVFINKAVHNLDIFRRNYFHIQCFRLSSLCNLRVHRIDTVSSYGLQLILCNCSLQNDHFCKLYCSICFHIHQSDALRCRICPLVILSRQILNSKKSCRIQLLRHLFVINSVNRRFCKYSISRSLISSLINPFYIVAIQNPDSRQPFCVKVFPNIIKQSLCLYIKAFLFFYIYSSYHLPALSVHSLYHR